MFIQEYRNLLSHCSVNHTDLTPDDAAALADRVERMIMVVEECTQLLQSSNYHMELSLLHSMHRNLSQNL